MYGLNWHDVVARQQDPELGRFTTVDPLAEKYYSWSPYVYCANNPMKYIDINGDSLTIAGKQSADALDQLQNDKDVKRTMTLASDNDGNITYSVNIGKNGKPIKLKGNAKRLAAVIDSKDIKVNVSTREGYMTSTGNLMIGGSFMGNTVNGQKVEAYQEVNPSVFSRAEAITGKTGEFMMHEVTEAFEGRKISQISGVGPATNADVANSQSVYSISHGRATSQPQVIENFYNHRGEIMPPGFGNPVHVNYTIKGKVFLTLPPRLR